MKKMVLYLCAGILALGLTACGGETPDGDSSGSSSDAGSVSSAPEESVPQSTEQTGDGDGSAEAEDPGNAGDGSAEAEDPGNVGESEGWSEEMAALRAAVVEAVGEEEYWPNMPMDGEMLNMFYGVSADMYDDFMAESPMISAHVDTLIIIKAKEGQADAVFDILADYRERLVNDTMQYPSNLGKIQASQVEKIGDYVVFVLLGGNTGLVGEGNPDEAETLEADAVANSQQANNKAMEAIKAKLGQ